MTDPKTGVLCLNEQERAEVLLLPNEATLLREKVGFEVLSIGRSQQSGISVVDDRSTYLVNPLQYVGHFSLPSGTTVIIRPKIPAANVFRMLTYVYAGWTGELFEAADVSYAEDEFLFEPLVQLLNQLVAKRARRGLEQDYIKFEDNLRVLKGAVKFSPHIRNNIPGHPDRVFCRFYENSFDIEDNRIIKWTLRTLMSSAAVWSDRTVQMLRANYQQFGAVSLKRPSRSTFDRRHYHRLNEDYRLIHGLCRLFLDGTSISEFSGSFRFSGFRLDMNELFEKFVTESFVRAAKNSRFTVRPQGSYLLSEQRSDFSFTIVPDITIFDRGTVISIVDAKYKKTENGFANQDFYQVLSYGTGLNCARTYLFFPTTEYARDGQVVVTHSPVTINIRRVDITDSRCVELVERLAGQVLAEAHVADTAAQIEDAASVPLSGSI
jgi:5-methylcytosine-specific restriction enzyme subunit McrC